MRRPGASVMMSPRMGRASRRVGSLSWVVAASRCCAALILRMLVTLILGMSWLRKAPPGGAWRGWVVPGVSRVVLRMSR